VRIISGTYRGKQLIAPKQLPVRPTTDFAKTGLFNIINNLYNFNAVSFLDLYAGTGSLSFEFLSRGCKDITSIDMHGGCCKYIKTTAALLNNNNALSVIQADVIKFLSTAIKPYDIIIADPPYAETPAEELTKIVFERKLIKPGGVFILEHATGNDLSMHAHYNETRKYGHVSFSFFRQ
jgi:16S rRNA (guanine(966)-N(2))-methyltransferase RsmD